jgi:hypothetical protein
LTAERDFGEPNTLAGGAEDFFFGIVRRRRSRLEIPDVPELLLQIVDIKSQFSETVLVNLDYLTPRF